MHDADEADLKAEIDQILQKIDDTIKKIEKIVPLKEENFENSENATESET